MTDNQTDPEVEPLRETVRLPDQIEFPRLLDFYELQDPAHTRIHQFYENLSNGQLTTTQCTDCEAVHFPPRVVCPECLSDEMEFTQLPHVGNLHSFTEIRGTAPIGMDGETPFVVGAVNLGPIRISTRIDDVQYDDLAIGDLVELKIIDVYGAATQPRVFYRFTPREPE